jgi:hypothetical protein
LPDWDRGSDQSHGDGALADEDVLAALARLIRRLHDAAQGWTLPPDAVWGVQRSGPGVPPPVDGAPELVSHRDYCPGNADADIPHRVAVFADVYGMSAEQRRDLVPMARRMIHRFHLSMRAAAESNPVFRALWEDSGRERLPRAEQWIEREGPAIAAQLTIGPAGRTRAQ